MTVRGMVTYNWTPASWFSQMLIGSAELRETDFITDLWHEKNELATTGALNGNASRIYYRVYVDDPGAYNTSLLGRRTSLPEDENFRRILFIDSGRGEASWARAYSVSASGRCFKGRLQSILGARLDTGKTMESAPWLNANRTVRGERLPITTYDETPERYTPQDARADIEETSHTTGLVYNVSLVPLRKSHKMTRCRGLRRCWRRRSHAVMKTRLMSLPLKTSLLSMAPMAKKSPRVMRFPSHSALPRTTGFSRKSVERRQCRFERLRRGGLCPQLHQR